MTEDNRVSIGKLVPNNTDSSKLMMFPNDTYFDLFKSVDSSSGPETDPDSKAEADATIKPGKYDDSLMEALLAIAFLAKNR